MSNYDTAVCNAKQRATQSLLRLPDCEGRSEMASAIDGLNEAWDKLTDALVRQRAVRDEEISRLLSALAEARK